jgi:serine/threonine protein kinase/Flp pilus assembly protein TadD
MTEESIFIEALRQETPAALAAFLKEACAGNAELRLGVEQLLRAHEKLGPFLQGAPKDDRTTDHPIEEGPGTLVGQYRLLEQIGEGGFGIVFMAEQQQPVRRKVALKVLKPGMDSKQVVARFEAERQALALMDHPNIAKVLDAGQTSSARPFFVMDLVRGLPITEYCDQAQLTTRQRLGLFLHVCRAVQHAHQKGVIHRDIKPSNVLVTLQDGTPLVKVIDFGIAKALGQQLTDKTLFTGFAQMIGTPLYMSPEQAALSNVDVDTRSDIYSLGVLLYELLTGTTPFDPERLHRAGYDEIRRIIREEEPPRPSTRISTLGQAATTISTQRKTDPKRLSQLVRGELDWIVMKALEKDRNRRYETASAFAADVERYLADEAVQACPPSAWYRFGKLARRNRGLLITASGILLTLALAVVVLAVSNARINEEKSHKETALSTADERRQEAQHNLEEAMRAVDQMLTRVAEDRVAQLPHMEPTRRGLLEDAVAFYQGFLAQNSSDTTTRLQAGMAHRRVGDVQHLLGDYSRAQNSFDQAIALLEALNAENPRDLQVRQELGSAYFGRARLLFDIGPPKEGELICSKALKLAEQLVADDPQRADYQLELAKCHNALGHLMYTTGRLPEAEKGYRSAAELGEQLSDAHPENPAYRKRLAQYYGNLAKLLGKTAKLKEAEDFSRKGLATAEQLAGERPKDPEYQRTVVSLRVQRAEILMGTGRFDGAEEEYRKALNLMKRLVADFPSRPDYRQELAGIHGNLGVLFWYTKRFEEAEKCWQQDREISEQLAADYPQVALYQSAVADVLNNFGARLGDQGKSEQASLLLHEAIRREEVALKINPNDPHYRFGLALHYLNLARVLGQRQAAGAQEAHSKAVELGKGLVADFPHRPAYKSHVARALHNLGDWRRHQNQFEEARRLMEEAILYEQQALQDNPRNTEFLQGLRRHYLDSIEVLEHLGRAREAEEAFRQLVAAYEEFDMERPEATEFRSDLGALLHNLAQRHKARGELDQAREILEKAVAHQRAALQVDPENVTAQVFLRNHYWVLADVHKGLGQLPAAEQDYRHCTGVLERLIALRPHEPNYQSDLGAKLNDWALLLSDDPRVLAEKRQLLEEAIVHQEAALKQKPANATYRRFLGHHCRNLGMTLVQQGLYAEADHMYRRCLAVREQLAREHPEDAAYQADLADVKKKLAELAERQASKKDV